MINEPKMAPSLETKSSDSCNRVLIADDDAMSRRILKSWLENWGYEVTVAENGEAAWEILQLERPPEIAILDWIMPKIDGVELCRMTRERQLGPYQYLLLVTSRDEKQDVVNGLEAGADDYLTKPLDRNELRARLRVGKRILTLQRGLIQAREDLRFQATHDALTGIWNRGTVLDLLHRELERAVRCQSATGVLMLDLDHFKRVNDMYGHLVGDVVLREAAQRMNQAVRSYDLVARYGGEEFLIVMPGCDKDQIQECAERVRTAIGGTPIVTKRSEVSVTVSIGAAVSLRSAITETDILAAADAALYQAKNSGRNRAVLSDAVYLDSWIGPDPARRPIEELKPFSQ
jgi:diguanylate cyclase (GGDEF)-like protein